MKYSKNLLAQCIVRLCSAKDISHIVISPGSRNAPLVIGFTQNDFFKCYSIIDERCAAFFALGMAQQLQQPVALVCTSGSALLNYYPAISEAFYSDIPLVVISADRPSHKIDIGDGQTIRQNNVFANHILYNAHLSDAEGATDNNSVEINKALHTAMLEKGPVHINAPFEEPLYEITNTPLIHPKILFPKIKKYDLNAEKHHMFIQHWNRAKQKMLLVGVLPPHSIETRFITHLANDKSVVVFTETTSNLHHDRFFPSIDKIIAPIEKNADKLKALQPDLLLSFGGMVISKKIKAFLRNHPPKVHFHVDEKKAYDTYFCLTHHFKTDVNYFFAHSLSELKPVKSTYQDHWLDVQLQRRNAHHVYLHACPFSDLKAYDIILKAIPEGHQLQSSNSATIRYTQLFDLNPGYRVFCNRGTSGIDGSTSTAIGAALTIKAPTTLLTGDLSFFYDSNALWNNYIRSDFRIILVNNQGGGIFRIISAQKDEPNFATYFETTHSLSAKQLCDMYGFDYSTANDSKSLTAALRTFYDKSNGPKLLEVFSPRTDNDEVLANYFRFLARH